MKPLSRALASLLAAAVLAASWPPSAALAMETEGPAGENLPRAGIAIPSGAPQLPAALDLSAAAAPEAPAAASASPEAAAPQAAVAEAAAARAEPKAAFAPVAKSVLGRASPSPARSRAAATPESAKAGADRVFDGALGSVEGRLVERPDWLRLAIHKVLSHRSTHYLLPAPLRSLAPLQKAAQPPAPRVVLKTTDDFGGPQALPKKLPGKILFGLKWGVNMVGLSFLIQLVLGPVFALSSWPLRVPAGTLHSLGRVELLTQFGPQAIAELVHKNPWHFFAQTLPLATGMEELVFRLGFFVLPFMALAAIRPGAQLAAKVAGSLSDPIGWRAGTQKALAWLSKLSVAAFPLAAVYSANRFAVAHFAAWGINPFFYSLHFALGLTLAYVLYRSRSLVAPFVAHLTYNALAVAAAFFLPLPLQLLVSALSVVFLFVNWRLHRKARAAAYAQARAEAQAAVRRSSKGATLLLLAALLGGSWLGLGGPVAQSPSQAVYHAAAYQQDEAQLPPQLLNALRQAAQQAQSPDLTRQQVVDKVVPSVAEIVVRMPNGYAIGSGYVVTTGGLMATNAHVVADAGLGGEVLVRMDEGGAQVKAKVVAINAQKDIALVQLPNRQGGWPALMLADSDHLRVGDEVMTFGHPQGLELVVSHGMVSSLRNNGSIYAQWVQIDAPITHGNSGGALTNMRGEVVGMDSAGMEGPGNLNFAIASSDVKAALDQYQATGNIDSAWLGIIVDNEQAVLPERGVVIEAVRPGSPAAAAGLRPGDVLVGVDGAYFPPGGSQALMSLAKILAVSKPGDKHRFKVARDGSEAFVTVACGEKAPPAAPKQKP